MEITTFVWIAFATIGLIIEVGTPGLFLFLSFAFGALVAALCSELCYDITVQGVLFGVATLTSFLLLKRWMRKQLSRQKFKTNIDALIGKKAIVVESAHALRRASVQINGDIWFAQEVDDTMITPHDNVEIVAVKGCHLIVKKIITQ